MKKFRVIAVFLLCVLCFVSFSSCSKLVKLQETVDGDFYDKTNNITYKAVPSEFQPMSYGDEYARWKIDGDDLIMYKVAGLEPSKWLYCVDFGVLYCAEDIVVPNPLAVDYNKMIICREENQLAALYILEDAVKISSIIININDGETMAYPSTQATYVYRLMFESTALPSIYYSVSYYEYTETQTGIFYFREDNHRCVVSNELLSKYVKGEE